MLYNSTQTHTKHTDSIVKSSISHKNNYRPIGYIMF